VIYWTFTTRQRVRCVAAADVDADGRYEVICAGDDEQIHLLDENGHERRSLRLEEQLVIGQGGTQEPRVSALLAADLDGDGTTEIVAGCTNSHISAYTPGLVQAWSQDRIYHGVRAIRAADLNGDGQLEILASDHYGGVHAISAQGERMGRACSEIGDVSFDVADIDGDGSPEIVNASGSGVTVAFGPDLEPRWRFCNYGYATRAVLCTDLDGDGVPEVVLASDTGYVYALGGDGRPWWQTDLGAPVTALVASSVGSSETVLAAGLQNGELVILNAQGGIVGGHTGEAPVKRILEFGDPDAGPRHLAVVDASGCLRVLA